jgi:predicted Zn-dependent protease
MKVSLKSKLVLLFGVLLLHTGCAQVPITGRKQLNLVPDAMINSMSFESYREFVSQHKLSSDARHTQMVKWVGARIQKAVEQYTLENDRQGQLSGYKWEFNLVEDSNVNAWAMPGGKVVVYTGLLPVARNDAGLAVVMGHEIAHAYARHGSERMSQGLLVDFSGMALSKAMSRYPDKTQNLFMRSFGIGTQVGILLPYSRVHESEADHLGLIFMATPQKAATPPNC